MIGPKSTPFRVPHVSKETRCQTTPYRPKSSFVPMICHDKKPCRIGTRMKNQLDDDLEASSLAIDEMVRAISRELLVDSAATYISGEGQKPEEISGFIRAAVASRLESLNTTFLPLLESYIEEVERNGFDQRDLLGILIAIRGETLAAVEGRLPPEIRITDILLRAPSEERMDLLKAHTSGDKLPSCTPEALALTISKLIEDMEGSDKTGDAKVVMEKGARVDRQTLAKLCLLREEARMVVEEGTWQYTPNASESKLGDHVSANSSPYTSLGSVPRNEASILKELLKVGEASQRRGILYSFIKGDGDGAPPFRIGAFLDCVKALQNEMLSPKRSGGSVAVPTTVLAQVENVWRDTIDVLSEVAE